MMTGFPEAGPRQRVAALIVYCAALLAIQYWIVEPHLPPSTINGLWFYAGIASLLLAAAFSILTSHRPVTPRSNAFVSSVSILAAWEVAHEKSIAFGPLYRAGGYCVMVFLATILSVNKRPSVTPPLEGRSIRYDADRRRNPTPI